MQTVSKSAWCLAAFCLLASRTPAAAQKYTLADLGTLPGNSVSAAGGLNDFGQAAGKSSSPTAAIGTIFSGGKATSVSTLGANVSVANAINASGQVVGYNIFYNNPTVLDQAFLYSNGSMVNINSSSLFPSGTIAYGVNDSGDVAGQGLVNSLTSHVFLYSGGEMTDLGTLGGFQAGANAINDSGEIVGNSLTASEVQDAFLYSDGKMKDLGKPSNAYASGAFAVNSAGEIAGVVYFNSGPSHAALYSNGAWTDLGAIPGAAGNTATGINLAGKIVGTAVFPQTQYHPPKPGKHVPFISAAGRLVDLNTLIPPGSGFTITDAVAINTPGQILCDATNAKGSEHAVLLTPQ